MNGMEMVTWFRMNSNSRSTATATGMMMIMRVKKKKEKGVNDRVGLIQYIQTGDKETRRRGDIERVAQAD